MALVPVGSRAYATNTLVIGLDPLPACRRSTPANPCAATASGCRTSPTRSDWRYWRPPTESDNIEDYYLSPWDLGYDFYVKFDHDFIGREALEKNGRTSQAPPEGYLRKMVKNPRGSCINAFATLCSRTAPM